jgi:isovaleryl-CoA dehydrogenase
MMTTWPDDLERILWEIVEPDSGFVDKHASFPQRSIEALARSGILGLTVSKENGGLGEGPAAAVEVVEKLSGACGSTAMIVLMHFCATAAIAKAGVARVLREIASGCHLAALALSEKGSRSQFWISQSVASKNGPHVSLRSEKSWVTGAHHANSYVWSTRPLAADGAMTLWLVPSETEGLLRSGPFDGLGLRGNDSVAIESIDALVPVGTMLSDDGKGLDLAMTVILPWFLVLSGAFCLGVMDVLCGKVAGHLCSARLDHLDETLIVQPVPRAALARMRIATDATRSLLHAAVSSMEQGNEDATFLALELKAFAAESAVQVADLAMRTCGGAAFRKETGIERHFRDSLAARIMAPTTESLYDFVGRIIGGLPLLEGS